MSSSVIFEKNGVVAEWHKGGRYTIRGPYDFNHTAHDRNSAERIAETMAHAMGVEQLKALDIGDSVELPMGADAYPDFHIMDPMTGTVASVEADCVWIKIDHPYAELDEWDNQIQVWFWDDGKTEWPGQVVTPPLLHKHGLGTGSLDEFIRIYCDANGIRCDGDVFGLMFSGADTYTHSGATMLIEQGAEAYNLRGK